ncbi:MAG: ergothioneine biosynthesis protein EgtB [Chloracidobacterium sp.]|nr:ergothioneine biosynthesis protein EgtB [Chloracidobacterium sp.]
MQPARSIAGGDLAAAYSRVRTYTETLCEPLETEDFIPQPVVDVSPARWNIAHTTWFFEEMILKKFLPDYKVFDPSFGFLFNSYYNTVGDRTARDKRSLSRPTVKRVFEYRKHVDVAMSQLLSVPPAVASGLTQPVDTPALSELVVLGLNHEQQHQELFLSDLKYTFSVNPLFPAYREGYAPEERSDRGAIATGLPDAGGQFVDLEGAICEIGYNGDGFCFDNEFARHKVYLDDFSISNRLITNEEFVEFINDGGYTDHRLWHSEGWDWVNREGVTSPLYWHNQDGEWHQFTLGGVRKLEPNSPVCHVSFYEAAAFAEWKGLRLPTEFEWEAANDKFDWGLRWEWTNSAYLPYPGFKKASGAVGEYNGKFMVNQMVLRGSSVATPEGHSRPTYRNFFHPHLRWQFTGIRLAR